MEKKYQTSKNLIMPNQFKKRKQVANFEEYVEAWQNVQSENADFEKYDILNIDITGIFKTFYHACMENKYYVIPDFHLIYKNFENALYPLLEKDLPYENKKFLEEKIQCLLTLAIKFFQYWQKNFKDFLKKTKINFKHIENYVFEVMNNNEELKKLIVEKLDNKNKFGKINKYENLLNLKDIDSLMSLRAFSEIFTEHFMPTLFTSSQMLTEIELVTLTPKKGLIL